MARPYHSLEDLIPACLRQDDFVALTQDDPESTTADESVWTVRRESADSEIDGFLGERYAVPLDTVPEMVRQISMGLTIHGLYQRRYHGQVPEAVTEEARRVRKLLRDLADGRPSLGLQPASAPNTQRAARLVSGAPIFSRNSLKGL